MLYESPRESSLSNRSSVVEQLEARELLSAYTPTDIRDFYGVSGLAWKGAGQTIAIVDAYDAPNINSDLASFNTKYGVSGTGTLTKATPQGKPRFDNGWAKEITLDVEWAHAIAPDANILLVEAKSNKFSDLLGAVDYARNYPGVVAVSMSWGSNEFSSERAYDSYFTTPAGHKGVTFVASSGDVGGVVSYPAASPNVLSVGGTTLNISTGAETGWSGSGGGVSRYEPKPAYQNSLTFTNRSTPDVAYDADPNTGMYVVYNQKTYVFGGTSAGAPQWAALVALADQARGSLGSLDGVSQTLPAIYSLGGSGSFRDITTGTAGSFRAGPGYDLVTGWGSPIAGALVPALSTWSGTLSAQTTTFTRGRFGGFAQAATAETGSTSTASTGAGGVWSHDAADSDILVGKAHGSAVWNS